MFAVLALARGAPVSREQITSLLWSDRGEDQARASLRQMLTELRKVLPSLDPPILVARRDTVQLDSDAVVVDAVAFEDLTDEGTPTALDRAAGLDGGDLLDGLGVHDPAYEDWLRGERQDLHTRASKALFRLLEHQASEGTERATGTAERLLALVAAWGPRCGRPVAAKSRRLMAGGGPS